MNRTAPNTPMVRLMARRSRSTNLFWISDSSLSNSGLRGQILHFLPPCKNSGGIGESSTLPMPEFEIFDTLLRFKTTALQRRLG